MSADQAFAAQMWTWPGPMLKRDAQGRVIVVNAAFLQMYGGQVQDWHGNAVGGWPEPQAPGSSVRFESKIPQPDGTELTYDWIEHVGPDGSALALGRDVSVYIVVSPVQAPSTQPIQSTELPEHIQESVTETVAAPATQTSSLLPQNHVPSQPIVTDQPAVTETIETHEPAQIIEEPESAQLPFSEQPVVSEG